MDLFSHRGTETQREIQTPIYPIRALTRPTPKIASVSERIGRIGVETTNPHKSSQILCVSVPLCEIKKTTHYERRRNLRKALSKCEQLQSGCKDAQTARRASVREVAT